LEQKSIQYLFDIFEHKSKEICLVGGCVRDALLGKISRDFDIAANVLPNEIIEILRNNNLRYEIFAYKYGSITTYINNQKFQITTLRQDVNQMGRDTNIVFTQDWRKDALRRDFTINALYLFRNGKIKDFFNGIEDLDSCTIKFIGNIEDSVQEDYLRILRYFRFLATFENPKLIENYDKLLSNYYQCSFDFLTNDLIRQEILKMFNSPFTQNSFFNEKKIIEKKLWVEITQKHFVKTGYKIGLNRCLNKIDLLIN
jgi:poly(A) polymerase